MTSMTVQQIGFDVPVADKYPSFTERYFIPRFCLDVAQKASEDHCILFHSNKICVVTLAPCHPVISENKIVSKVNFQVAEKINRLNNSVKGKGKHGAQFLQPSSVLCVVECEDGSKYSIRSCIHGKLIEINENLVNRPQLLVEKPNADGYVAIVLPNKERSDEQKDKLATPEEYWAEVAKRDSLEKETSQERD